MIPPKNVLIRPSCDEERSGTKDVERPVAPRRLPTALAERMRSTPRTLKPKMFARKFSSDASVVWPLVPRQKCDAFSKRPDHA
jgi:hypothetical protein